MDEHLMREKLEDIRAWARAKVQSGHEPPWAWYQYMKLIEAANAILKGMASTATMESSQQSESRLGTHLRLVEPTRQQDTAPTPSA
jgi:hypothetical protein